MMGLNTLRINILNMLRINTLRTLCILACEHK